VNSFVITKPLARSDNGDVLEEFAPEKITCVGPFVY
jgi:hypothetical protein